MNKMPTLQIISLVLSVALIICNIFLIKENRKLIRRVKIQREIESHEYPFTIGHKGVIVAYKSKAEDEWTIPDTEHEEWARSWIKNPFKEFDGATYMTLPRPVGQSNQKGQP